jgi:hypothetical protein
MDCVLTFIYHVHSSIHQLLEHPQYKTHQLRCLSKLRIAELVGTPPACPTEYNSRTQKKCDTFAQYILTIFKPWDLDTKTPTADESDYSWKGLCEFLTFLGNENSPWYNRSILKLIENIRVGVKSSSLERTLTTDYRARGCVKWGSPQQDSDGEGSDGAVVAQDQAFRSQMENEENTDKVGDAQALINAINAFAATDTNAENKADIYLNKQHVQFTDLLKERMHQGKHEIENDSVAVDEATVNKGIVHDNKNIPDVKAIMSACLDEFTKINRSGKENDDDVPMQQQQAEEMVDAWNMEAENSDLPKRQITDKQILTEQGLTEEQLGIYNEIMGAIENNEQILLCLMNGPGVGKTHVLKTVEMILNNRKQPKRTIVTLATTGAAASIFGLGARTVHSGLGIGTRQSQRQGDGRLQPLKLQKLSVLKELYKNTKAVVIDEISMLTPTLLGDADIRLRQISEKDEPFGGFIIVLAGDFQQLPPAVGDTLYTGVLSSSGQPASETKSLYEHQSRKLFGKFTIRRMLQFHRATDERLLNYLKQMRDLNNKYPLRDKQILNTLFEQPLSKENLQGDWKDALICVQSNNERFHLNEQFIKLKAIEMKDVLLWWDNEITHPPSLPEQVELHLRKKFSAELNGYFLKGAPVILTSNVAPVLQVANGSNGVLDSVIYIDEGDRRLVSDQIAIAKVGSMVKLHKQPDYIIIKLNMEIPTSVKNNATLNIGNMLYPERNDSGYLIPMSMTKDMYNKNVIKFGPKDKMAIIKYNKFPFDLLYACTTYKLQGATVTKLIVDLNQRPQGLKAMDLRSLYVILSRVKDLGDLRIVPFRQHVTKANMNVTNFLNYMKDMSQNDNLVLWNERIDETTKMFVPIDIQLSKSNVKRRKK